MKVAELIKLRSPYWEELEDLSIQMGGGRGKADPDRVSRFATLYRAACADWLWLNRISYHLKQ